MQERYVSVSVEYGRVGHDEEGNAVVYDDTSESFDMSDPTASFASIFDDIAFEVRNALEA